MHSTSNRQPRRSSLTHRYSVVNQNDPGWSMVDLLPPEEDEHDNSPKWKKYAKIILPHVGLILLSLSYVVVGAAVFYRLERQNEVDTRRFHLAQINETRAEFLFNMWDIMEQLDERDEEEFDRLAKEGMQNMTRLLFEAFDTHYISAGHLRRMYKSLLNVSDSVDEHLHEENLDTWTFLTAVFFTSTLLTTIGYGNLVPVTFNGRMFCICYGLFGVPLILITVADIGKFLSENIVWLYCHYIECKKKAKRRWQRSEAKQRSSRVSAIDQQPQQQQASRASASGGGGGGGGGQLLAETDSDGADGGGEGSEEDEQRLKEELEKFGLEDYVSIPVTLILFILGGYIAAGAVLLGRLEGWDFFTGFYFSFITMTTVGFGDIVPVIQRYYLLDLLYIVVGLAITTMCIDLVGIQYIRKIHYFGRAIKDARYALVNVGGKMVHVPDLMRYASVLQRKYGRRKSQQQQAGWLANERWRGAYTPRDIRRIRYIDYSSDSLASCYSNCFRRTSTTTPPSNDDYYYAPPPPPLLPPPELI